MDEPNNHKDLQIVKAFDMKIKKVEMETMVIDESIKKLGSIYILKNKKVYIINILTRKLKELSFSKGHSVIHICGNSNNNYLIILFHNGKIFAIYKPETPHEKIIYIKNLRGINELDNSILTIYANDTIDKIIVINNKILALWVQIEEKYKEQYNIKEAIGYTTLIQIEKERNRLIEENNFYCENYCINYGNNYILGSYAQVFYIIVVNEKKLNVTKVYLIQYLYRFERENNFRAYKSDGTGEKCDCFEYKKYSNYKYVYTYLIPRNAKYSNDKKMMIPIRDKEENIIKHDIHFDKNIIMKSNSSGKKIAIAINNCPDDLDVISLIDYNTYENIKKSSITLIIFSTETYKFTSCYLDQKFKAHFQKSNNIITVTDIAWLNMDLFIIVQLSDYTFIILDKNFEVIEFYEKSKYISKFETDSKVNILDSFKKMRSNKYKISLLGPKSNNICYFTMYSPIYAICFYFLAKNYEDRILYVKENNKINDFIEQLKYIQSECYMDKREVIGRLHTYLQSQFPFLINTESSIEIFIEQPANKLFLLYLQIIKNINFKQDDNLMLISYFICLTSDFFYYLLSQKEIWYCYMILTLCEKYIMKLLKLTNFSNKNNEKEIMQRAKGYMIFNPYTIENINLRSFSDMSIKVYKAKLNKFRVLLLLFGLLECKNNQSFNINMIYFIFAKMILFESNKKKHLDEVYYITKIFIRNWRNLKQENNKAGRDQYILSHLRLNIRYELLKEYITKNIRKDLKFEFFNCFYSIEELQTFSKLNKNCCRLDEESLLDNFSYLNHTGIIQRWMLLFTNSLYSEMFDECKQYLNQHLTKGNVALHSPDEENLSRLVYYNLYFFLNLLEFSVLVLIIQMTPNVHNENVLIDNFSKQLYKFISPVDIPFIIFEHASGMYLKNIKDNNLKGLSPFDINNVLFGLFERYQKDINMSLLDGMEFIDEIIIKGFSYNEKDNLNAIPQIQKYIYSSIIFIMICVCKTKTFNFLIKYQDEIIRAICCLEVHIKRELYLIILIILNAYLKTIDVTINNQNDIYIQPHDNKYIFNRIILFQKRMFYEILCNENTIIQENILLEFINDSFNFMRVPLCEGGVYHVYKKFKRLLHMKEDDNPIEQMNKFYKNEYINDNNKRFMDYIFKGENAIEANILFRNFAGFLYEYDHSSYSNNQNNIKVFMQTYEDVKGFIDIIAKMKAKDNIIDNIQLLLIKTVTKFIYLISSVFPLYKLKINMQRGEMLKWYSFHLLFTKDDLEYNEKVNYIISYLMNSTYNNIKSIKENMLQIIRNIFYGNIIHNLSNATFLNKIESIIKDNQTIMKEYDNIKIKENSLQDIGNSESFILSKKIRKMNLLIDNTQYIQILNEIISIINTEKDHYNIIIDSEQSESCIKRKKISQFIDIFSSLSGIQSTFSIVLNESYEYQNNQYFYNCIYNKDSTFINQSEELYKDNIESICEERQKANYVKITNINHKSINTNLSLLKDCDNITFREENYHHRKLTIKSKQMYNRRQNQSCIIVEQKKKNNNINNQLKHFTMSFIRKIKRVFFHQFLNCIFAKYKKNIDDIELEQIEFLNITPEENKCDIITLKEKYLSPNDIANNINDDNSDIKVKKYDLLKLNKIKIGDPKKSKISNELKKQKSQKKMYDIVRGRINELKIRLEVFQDMVNELGKNFVCKLNK